MGDGPIVVLAVGAYSVAGVLWLMFAYWEGLSPPTVEGRSLEERRSTTMSYQPSHRTTATRHQPPPAAAEIDALVIDDEFDDFLDQHVFTLRDSLADFRNL